ncbi:MAG: hypothetical protein ACN4E2_06390 [Nitrospinota bacterium]
MIKVTCDSCKKLLSISDSKLPAGKKSFTINCPSCHNRMSVNLNETKQTERLEVATPLTTSSIVTSKMNISPDLSLSNFALDSELAMIASAGSTSQVLEGIAVSLGYKPLAVSNSADAIKKLELARWKLIFINELFDSKKVESNKFLLYLSGLTMDIRRDIFVVMISREIETVASLTAFSNSVNIIINEGDINNAEEVVTKAMKSDELFYKPLKQALEQYSYGT